MKHHVGHYCVSAIYCLGLATMLFGCLIVNARGGNSGVPATTRTTRERRPTARDDLLEIPLGTTIEVKLLNKQKVRGKLGERTDEGFNLTTMQDGKISSQKVTFTEVKSVKVLGPQKNHHTLILLLALCGALAAMLIIWGIPEGTHPYPSP